MEVLPSRKVCLLDALVLATCFVLYVLNRFIVAPAGLAGPLAYLFSCHFNDFLAGAVLLAGLNVGMGLLSRRVRSFCICIALVLIGGLWWEYVTPNMVAGSVSDPLDILAYLLGGVVYLLLDRWTTKAW